MKLDSCGFVAEILREGEREREEKESLDIERERAGKRSVLIEILRWRLEYVSKRTGGGLCVVFCLLFFIILKINENCINDVHLFHL